MVPFRSHLVAQYLRRLAALATITLTLPATSADNPASPEGLNRWLAQQADIQTWSAEVTQTRTLQSLAQPLTTQGRVWFKAPNLFRWELGQPARTIAIREPEQLVLLYPRLKRAEIYPLTGDKTGPWRSSLTLLEAGFPRQQDDLTTQFNVLKVETSGESSIVHLEPKAAEARRWVTSIQVTLRTTNLNLEATQLTFADGSTLRNEFHNAQPNSEINPDLLKASIPSDFETSLPTQ
ncbi:MAG: hypothetical protein RI897_3454 [Verrucomicrobiota bacterium]